MDRQGEDKQGEDGGEHFSSGWHADQEPKLSVPNMASSTVRRRKRTLKKARPAPGPLFTLSPRGEVGMGALCARIPGEGVWIHNGGGVPPHPARASAIRPLPRGERPFDMRS